MKKFLRIVFPEKTEVPTAVEERILAAAALRAHGFRRRRQLLKLGLPAAAAALVLMSTLTFFPHAPKHRPRPGNAETSGAELLGLADMTVVDEGNFLLAAMSELEPADESFSI